MWSSAFGPLIRQGCPPAGEGTHLRLRIADCGLRIGTGRSAGRVGNPPPGRNAVRRNQNETRESRKPAAGGPARDCVANWRNGGKVEAQAETPSRTSGCDALPFRHGNGGVAEWSKKDQLSVSKTQITRAPSGPTEASVSENQLGDSKTLYSAGLYLAIKSLWPGPARCGKRTPRLSAASIPMRS
jgi:hypothetical protein